MNRGSSDAKTQIEDIVMEMPRTSPGVETVWRFLRTKLAGVKVDTVFSDLFVYLRIGRRARVVCSGKECRLILQGQCFGTWNVTRGL